MKQILQDLRSGRTIVEGVPAPLCRKNHLRIATTVSLISAGTERMMVDFSRASLVEKAMQQPEKVREVIQKVRTDGLVSTVEAVRSKLDQPVALGYCNVGRVLEVGAGVAGFQPGDRVVSNGRHAEVVVVPWTLCARIPPQVTDESAAFAVLGAVALQGVRLAAPTLGECFVVTGLGLVGLLAVQMLKANGCRVLGVDNDPSRIALARLFGAETVDLSKGESVLDAANAFSRGRGVDGVLLTLSTKSSEPVSQAARMCRTRGRVVLVGVTGLEINRSDFYEKEISFQVSCSYGPGRYDPDYEENGQDYPVGYVRWTEQRNFEAVLDMIADGRVDVAPLITHRFSIETAPQAYDVLAAGEPSLGILLNYPGEGGQSAVETRVPLASRDVTARGSGRAMVGFIGAGNYAGRVLIGAFKEAGAELHTIASSNGVSASHHGSRAGFAYAASDTDAVLDCAEIDTVTIASRHDSHAAYVRAALQRGKNVFVEKPLCLTTEELECIAADLTTHPDCRLMVGFNRRFAPMVVKAKALLSTLSRPKSFVMTVNAGPIPNSHWTQDPSVGGGRLVGEACHFIDLLRHLAGAPIRDFEVVAVSEPGGPPRSDIANITLRFDDGSIGVVNYLANGHKAYPKERLEIFCGGRVLLLNNFRELTGYGWQGFSRMRSWRQDKGQTACVGAFISSIKSGRSSPIPSAEILEVSRIAIEVADRACSHS